MSVLRVAINFNNDATYSIYVPLYPPWFHDKFGRHIHTHAPTTNEKLISSTNLL